MIGGSREEGTKMVMSSNPSRALKVTYVRNPKVVLYNLPLMTKEENSLRGVYG